MPIAPAQKYTLPPSVIRVDESVLPRVANDEALIEQYDQVLRRYEMPPLLVVCEKRNGDNAVYWLADGSFRLEAHKRLSVTAVPVSIVSGTREDAVWIAAGANTKHGRPLTRGEKGVAVRLILATKSGEDQSNQAIADQVGCDVSTVVRARRDMGKNKAPASGGRPRLDGAPTKPNLVARPTTPPPVVEKQQPLPVIEDDPEDELPPLKQDVPLSSEPQTTIVDLPAPTPRVATGGRPTKAQSEFRAQAIKQDKAGTPIPDWLLGVAEQSIRIDEFCTTIGKWVSGVLDFAQKSSGGSAIPQQELVDLVQDMRVLLQRARFYACCPKCIARGKAIERCVCDGLGWLTQDQFTQGRREGAW